MSAYQTMETAMKRRNALAKKFKWAQRDFAEGRETERGLQVARERWEAACDTFNEAVRAFRAA